jgi:site-specific recombinase XerD
VRLEAGSSRRDGPHVLRHSAATAFMAAGADPALIAGYLGMDLTTLMSTYAHHHPAFQAGIAQVSPGKRVNQERTGRR